MKNEGEKYLDKAKDKAAEKNIQMKSQIIDSTNSRRQSRFC
jgi:hypothetical protein